MKTRVIHTRFWEDEKVANLSREAKFLFIYLLTNSRINLIGIFELTDRIIQFETGFEEEELTNVKEELCDNQRVIFYNGWIYVVNAMKHSNYTGDKNDIAKEKEAGIIPKEVANYFESIGFEIPYRYGIDSSRTYKQKIESNRTQDNDEIDLDDIEGEFVSDGCNK